MLVFLSLVVVLSLVVTIGDYLLRKRTNDILDSSGFVRRGYQVPILGDTLDFVGLDHRDVLGLFDKARQLYGKVSPIWIFHLCIFIVSDVKFLEHMLTSKTMVNKSFFYQLLSPWLRNGVLLSGGEKNFKRRRILMPAFHLKILKDFVEIFDQQARTMVELLEPKADGKTAMDILPAANAAALDILAESSLGVQLNAQRNGNMEYINAVKIITEILTTRFLKSEWYLKWGFMLMAPKTYIKLQKNLRIAHDFTNKLIVERRRILQKIMEQKSFKEDTNETDDPLTRLKERHSLMDQLLLSTIDGKPLTNADIQEEIDTLIFGGQDSTATAVSSILHFLSRHPESQQQVYDEILNVFGNEKDFSIEMDQLQDLKYLECVIKESLRLHPPIPLISRVTSEDTKVGNQIIPAKAMICMSLFNINRDPDLYSSPNEFQPERFMNTSHDETYNPYAFVPFSAGPRKCIGYKFAMLEMKILVSRIVRHYELLPLGPEIVPIASITLSSTTGFNLGLKPRVDV